MEERELSRRVEGRERNPEARRRSRTREPRGRERRSDWGSHRYYPHHLPISIFSNLSFGSFLCPLISFINTQRSEPIKLTISFLFLSLNFFFFSFFFLAFFWDEKRMRIKRECVLYGAKLGVVFFLFIFLFMGFEGCISIPVDVVHENNSLSFPHSSRVFFVGWFNVVPVLSPVFIFLFAFIISNLFFFVFCFFLKKWKPSKTKKWNLCYKF